MSLMCNLGFRPTNLGERMRQTITEHACLSFATNRPVIITGVAAAYFAALAVFAYLASDVHQFPGEVDFSLWLQSWRTSWLDGVMYAISVPGLWKAALPIVAATLTFLFLTGRRGESGLLLVAVAFAAGANVALKEIVARPRPAGEIVEVFGSPSSFGFPSGHVMSYVVFLGILVFIFTCRAKPGARRRLTHGLLILALIGVGMSRMYLGVHTLTDVLGGYAFGAGVVLVFAAIWMLWIDAKRRPIAGPAPGRPPRIAPI